RRPRGSVAWHAHDERPGAELEVVVAGVREAVGGGRRRGDQERDDEDQRDHTPSPAGTLSVTRHPRSMPAVSDAGPTAMRPPWTSATRRANVSPSPKP